MKVLISAYACEPGKGSEPMVGWCWANEISKLGHKVWVMTRANNRSTIQAYEENHGSTGIEFVYFDLPRLFLKLKRLPGGIYPYYYLWQLIAFFHAFRLQRAIGFDRVHQLTFVSIRFPTFMTLLGVPSILGPMGGGERSPHSLRRALGLRFWLLDTWRSVVLLFHRLDPVRALGMTFASQLCATTEQSVETLPWWVRKRTQVLPAIACAGSEQVSDDRPVNQRIELLYAGLHKDWKGLRLGMRALQRAQSTSDVDYHLTVVGRGKDHQLWRREVKQLGLQKHVEFIDWMPRDKLLELYGTKDAFLFPSLHDSGGLVVLEAMARGLPVICLACGGPGLSVDAKSGHRQDVSGLSADQIIDGLADGLRALENPNQRTLWSQGARQRADELTWRNLVRAIYPVVDE